MVFPKNSLNNLNEYCIIEIYKYLDKTTQLVLSAVNKNFRKIFFETNPSLSISPKDTENISNETLEEIFRNIGEYIEIININSSPLLALTSKYCCNLKDLSIEFYNHEIPELELKLLANNNRNLKNLSIACGKFNDEQLDYFNDLEYLNLVDTKVKGDSLKKFKNINTLICSSTFMKFNSFEVFCKECNKSLRALDIRASEVSRGELYQLLAEYCPNLEYLAVDSIRVTKQLNKNEYLIPLKSLKHLVTFNVEDFSLPETLISLCMFSQYWELEETEYIFNEIENMNKLETVQFAGANAMSRILWNNIKFPSTLKKISVEVPPYMLQNDDFFTFIKNSTYDFELIYHVDINKKTAENFSSRLQMAMSEKNIKTNTKVYEKMEDYPKEVLIPTFTKPFNSFFDMRIQWGY